MELTGANMPLQILCGNDKRHDSKKFCVIVIQTAASELWITQISRISRFGRQKTVDPQPMYKGIEPTIAGPVGIPEAETVAAVLV